MKFKLIINSTPLILAVQNDYPEIVEALLTHENIDINYKNIKIYKIIHETQIYIFSWNFNKRCNL